MSTLKTTNIQNASSATTNIALDTSGGVTVGAGITASNGTVVMSSPYTMRNKIINGAMVINQRATSVTSTNYTVDRWAYYGSQASKGTVSQSSTAPTGYTNSLLFTSSSAYSVLTTDIFQIYQTIEGLNIIDLAWGTASAQSVTLSFWVRSSITGTFGGIINNQGPTRSYPFTYTISSANTWEQKTITIAGDTTGTWLTTNGAGISVGFSLGTGSTYSAAAGSWAAGNYQSATGATSVVGTNGATWYVTGVQLERGTVATPFEYRNYQQELAMCQRYYWQWSDGGNATGLVNVSYYLTTRCFGVGYHPVTMRIAPSITFSAAANFQTLTTTANTVSAITSYGTTPNTFTFDITTSATTAGFAGFLRSSPSLTALAAFSAEL